MNEEHQINKPSEISPRNSHPPTPERVSEVVGERVCIGCGFNLFGQPIVREQHYALLIVRCPECGTVAALHEYPLLGKWANRWGRLFAVIWIFVIFIFVQINAGIITGYSAAMAKGMLQPTASTIGANYKTWALANQDEANDNDFYNHNLQSAKTDKELAKLLINPKWWVNHGRAEIRQQFRTLSPRYDWHALSTAGVWLIRLVPLLLFTGILWSIIVPTRSISRIAIFLFITYGFAAAWILISLEFAAQEYYYWESAQQVARIEFGRSLQFIAAAIALLPLGLSLYWGRSVARGLAIGLLPPHMRGWVAFLWIVDGKTPPKKTWLDR